MITLESISNMQPGESLTDGNARVSRELKDTARGKPRFYVSYSRLEPVFSGGMSAFSAKQALANYKWLVGQAAKSLKKYGGAR